jgi:amino acid permease
MQRIELPRFQVLRDESYGTSEESSRVVTPRESVEQSTTVGSVFGGVMNLSAAAVGVGIVALPYAFSLLGIMGGIVSVCVMGALTGITLGWLLECSLLSKKSTFEGNVKFFLGHMGYRFFSFNIVLLLFGGCVAMYLVSVSTMRAIWDSVLMDIVVALCAVGLSLVVIEDPGNRLGFTSSFAIACAGYICVLLGLQWWSRGDTKQLDKCADPSALFNLRNFVSSTCVLLNSFIMNFIFFEVVSNIPRGPTLPVKVTRIVGIALALIILPLYIFIGVGGIYGLDNCGEVPSNIFASDRWSISPLLVGSGRIALSLLNIFKFPLVMLPLCHTLFPDADENRRVQLCTLFPFVIGASYLLGDISQVLNWIGTTCGISLSFLVPSAMLYRLQDIEGEQADLAARIMTYHQSLPETDPVTPSASRRAKKRSWKKCACLFLIMCSVLYAVMGICVDLTTYPETLATYFSVW